MAPNSILNDDIPIDRIRWALPRRYFFCGDAGALRGGERPHEGVTEDLPLSNDGMKCMDPVATLQDDVKGNALE